jgi:hypothetical protein
LVRGIAKAVFRTSAIFMKQAPIIDFGIGFPEQYDAPKSSCAIPDDFFRMMDL